MPIAVNSAMSMEEEARAVELAMQRAKGKILLVEDNRSKIWMKDGQIYKYMPGANRRWNCRKLNAKQLVKIAPARRILEVLQEAY